MIKVKSLSTIKYDFVAGLVVFVVAIPLCLGIALASGAPLFSGIISGIIGGIVVGILSESAISVSGPAAGMVAVVLAAIATLGDFNALLLALVFAGILQIIIGVFKAGFVADYIPSNVIQGLLCAIGVLIILKQIPFLLTYTSKNDELLVLLTNAVNGISLEPLRQISGHINSGAVIISLVSFAILIFFDQTKNKFFKKIPGPVVAVLVAALINQVFVYLAPALTQFDNELVNIPLNNGVEGFLSNFSSPKWSAWVDPNVYLFAFIFAAVASLEALLNLEGVEKLDKQKRYCSRNRELVAQGVGNTLSGLVGGLPITSVIVRSSVNIQAGAKTKLSTIIHGFLILLVVFFVPHLINLIPLAALAAILIQVGYKLSRPVIYREMYAQGMNRFFPFFVTVFAIVMFDLLSGVIIGLFTSFFFILRSNSRMKIDIINEHYPSQHIKRLVLPEHMSFLRKASLLKELNSIENGSNLIVDARNTKYIDHDILEVIDVYRHSRAPRKEIEVSLVGFKEHYEIHDYIDFVDVTTYEVQASLSPEDVLKILKEGNKRLVDDRRIHRNLQDELKAVSAAQHPIAIVLGCIDSRVPIETVFDMGLGDVFVARVAGNVINDDIISSIEFATYAAGAKLIVVLGHTHCGAIQAACDAGEDHFLAKLLSKVKPAIDAEKTISSDRNSKNSAFVERVVALNVENSLQNLAEKSQIVSKLIQEKQVGLIGAVYDIESGCVKFDDHFYQIK